LDAKEREINERKAKIRSLLNQELNKPTPYPKAPSTTSSFLNQTLPPPSAASSQPRQFFQKKVKPPSEIERRKKRESVDRAVDSVSELIKGAYD
jgi:hypothetical protein